MGETVCAHIHVTGVVQGVFFRKFVTDHARRLGIRGWVRNCPDGSVEAQAVGAKGLVQDLIEEVKVGPPASHVSGCNVEWRNWVGDRPEGFSVQC